MVDKQIAEKRAEEQLLGLRAMKLLIFSENTIARQGSTCKQNGTHRWGLGLGLMANVGDHYDKVMKERHMTGVQPGRAWGPPCLTNTLCAR